MKKILIIAVLLSFVGEVAAQSSSFDYKRFLNFKTYSYTHHSFYYEDSEAHQYKRDPSNDFICFGMYFDEMEVVQTIGDNFRKEQLSLVDQYYTSSDNSRTFIFKTLPHPKRPIKTIVVYLNLTDNTGYYMKVFKGAIETFFLTYVETVPYHYE